MVKYLVTLEEISISEKGKDGSKNMPLHTAFGYYIARSIRIH